MIAGAPRLQHTRFSLRLVRTFPFPSPCSPPSVRHLFCCFPFFFFFKQKKNLIFQRDKGRIKEELAAAKQQLHLQTRGHYNEAAEALPRQHTGRWRGNMVTHWQRRQEGGGRVGGNKGRKREMEVVILGVFTCSSRWKGALISPPICRISQPADAYRLASLLYVIDGGESFSFSHLGKRKPGFFGFQRCFSFAAVWFLWRYSSINRNNLIGSCCLFWKGHVSTTARRVDSVSKP